MSTTTVAPPPLAPEPPAQIGAFGRIIGALVSPGKTFADIARKPSWILPIVLLIILGLVTTYFFGARVGWEKFAREQMMNSPQFANADAATQNQTLQQQLPFYPIFGYVGVVVVWIAFPILVGLIYMLAFNVMAGAGVKFMQAWGIVAHASSPMIVAGILGIVVLFLKDPADVDLQNLIGSNVSAFFDADAPKWLKALGGNLDLFLLWCLLLEGIGFSAVNPKKVSIGKGIGIVFGLFALYVMIRVGIAAI